jgi:hypothetical protein
LSFQLSESIDASKQCVGIFSSLKIHGHTRVTSGSTSDMIIQFRLHVGMRWNVSPSQPAYNLSHS